MLKLLKLSPLKLYCIIFVSVQIQIKSTLCQDPHYNRLTYCQLDCGSSIHTICETGYPCHDICRYGYNFRFLSDNQRESILNQHNEMRNWIASGNESAGHQQFAKTEATNMRVLSWSKEAEYIASCVAKRCDAEGDGCRTLANGMDCGQNFYIQTPIRGMDLKKIFQENLIFEEIITKWYKDFRNYKRVYKEEYEDWKNNVSGVFSETTYSPNVKYFSQLVWAKTQFVGCAYNVYRFRNSDHALLYCNYCPSGNVIGHPIYEVGDQRPYCGADERYPYLCGIQVPLADDKFKLSRSKILLYDEMVILLSVVINGIVYGY